MQSTDPKGVLAILCGDIHLSHKPPIGRSAEPNWYEAMSRSLGQLRSLQKRYDCPVICAGDVFDKWNAPAELINFAMMELPDQFYAIPGQHDLPNHRLEDLSRSAYFTLMQTGRLSDISGGLSLPKLEVYGFAWGADLLPFSEYADAQLGYKIHLAVVHAYCWLVPGTKYSGAPARHRLSSRLDQLKGYDVVHFGDNHQYWFDKRRNVINCGTFMRRKADDQPESWVAALLDTGEIHPLALDNSEDKWIHQDDGIRKLERDWGIQEFIEDLSQLSSSDFDFAQQVRRFVHDNKVSEQTRNVLLNALENTE